MDLIRYRSKTKIQLRKHLNFQQVFIHYKYSQKFGTIIKDFTKNIYFVHYFP